MLGKPSELILALLVSSWAARLAESFVVNVFLGNSRRLAGLGEEDIGSGEAWKAYQERCGAVDFDLYLSIGVHFTFYLRPASFHGGADGATAELCHPLMLHADTSGEHGNAKDVYEVDDEDLSPTFFEDGSLALGSFRLSDIAHAFDSIDVDAAGEREYNIVTNNCAVLILGMMKQLGIQLSPNDRAKVANGLVQADVLAENKLAQYIRNSGEIERSLGLTKEASNQQLLERLTLRQISLALDGESETQGYYSTDLIAAAAEASTGGARRVGQPLHGETGQSPVSGDKAGTNDRNLIVGGTPVTTQTYPFFVQSEEVGLTEGYPDLPMCGGVLVAPDVVLTTVGECYNTWLWSRRVMVGSTILSNSYLGAEWRNIVSDIVIHPKYKKIEDNPNYYTYDFALMKIEAVTLPNLIPVVLNSDATNPTVNENLTTVGYGRISDAGDYAPSPGLRQINLLASANCSNDFPAAAAPVALCAKAPNRDTCGGDYGGPLLDANLTLVGLVSSGKFCQKGSPNLFSRVSGAIDWIQETICELSDFRGNYTFCPSVVCPVDLTLLGELNSSVLGGAALPAVQGSMLTPSQNTVVQSPPAGTLIKPGQRKTVTVLALDSSNVTIANCTWVVRVPPIEFQAYVLFRAKRRNSSAVQYYSLNVPYAGRYQYVDADVSFKVERAKNAVLGVTFRRVNYLNFTDSTFLQSFKVRGSTKFNVRYNVTADVAAPDNSTYLYAAYFDAKGIKAAGDVYFYLYGQAKKM